MKFSKKYFLILPLLITIAILALVFRKPQTQSPVQQSEPIIDNTLKETPAELMPFTFDFQINQENSLASVFWDQTAIKIFYLILLDKKEYEKQQSEEAIIWAISALASPAQDLSKIEKIETFLSPPYIIGKKVQGFSTLREGEIILENGKEYWLQLVGIDNDKKVQFTSKKFILGQND